MAERITGHLYRVGLDSEYNHTYFTADSLEDLIRHLVQEYTGEHRVVGVKELYKDGSIHPVDVTGHPVFQKLTQEQLRKDPYLPVEIDGSVWAVLLPTGGLDQDDRFNVWEQTIRVTAQRNDLLHYHTILSLCRDRNTQAPDLCIGRGCMAVHYRSAFSKTLRKGYFGYRPMLIPLDRHTLRPEPERLAHLHDGSRLKLGTLYMDGEALRNPQNPVLNGDIPKYHPGAKLRFWNTAKDKALQIQWIKVGNALVCDRNILRNLSWNDLNDQCLIYGKGREKLQVTIENNIQKARELSDQQGRGEASKDRTHQTVR